MNTKYQALVDIVLPTDNPKADFLKENEFFFIREELNTGKLFPIEYKLLNHHGFYWRKIDRIFVNFIRNNINLFREIE